MQRFGSCAGLLWRYLAPLVAGCSTLAPPPPGNLTAMEPRPKRSFSQSPRLVSQLLAWHELEAPTLLGMTGRRPVVPPVAADPPGPDRPIMAADALTSTTPEAQRPRSVSQFLAWHKLEVPTLPGKLDGGRPAVATKQKRNKTKAWEAGQAAQNLGKGESQAGVGARAKASCALSCC